MPVPVYASSAEAIAASVEDATDFRPLSAWRSGWKMYIRQPFLWSLFTAGVLVVTASPMFIPLIPVNALIALTFSAIGLTGYWIGARLAEDKGRTTFAELLSPSSDFGQVVAGHVVSTLGIVLGSLLVLPGIFLFTALRFVLPLVFLKRMPFWPAMGLTIQLVRKQFWGWLAFDLMCLAVLAVGAALAGVGLLVAFPWIMLSRYAAFEQVFSKTNA